jgi:hypothetical protein
MTIAGDVYTYNTPTGGDQLEVVYTRVWCYAPWKFNMLAIDVATARLLSSTVTQTEAGGRAYIEEQLRAQRLIS